MSSKRLDIHIVVQMGFDVLQILTDRFRQEMGRQFDEVWKACVSELKGPALDLFGDIRPEKENLEINVTIVASRYQNRMGDKDELLVLDAFVELIRLTLIHTRELLGDVLVNKALQEALEILFMVDKYQQDVAAAEYFIEKIRGIP